MGSILILTPTLSHALAMASIAVCSTAGTKHCPGCFTDVMGGSGCSTTGHVSILCIT